MLQVKSIETKACMENGWLELEVSIPLKGSSTRSSTSPFYNIKTCDRFRQGVRDKLLVHT